MATGGLGHGEVKSIEDGLEISPSATQGTSKLYSGSSDNPQAKKHSPKNKSENGSLSESDFGQKGKAKRRNLATKL
jgi:hypothetical protein